MELLERRFHNGAIVSRCHSRHPLVANTEDMHEAIHSHDLFKEIDEYLRKARANPDLVAAVPGNAYVVHSGGSAVSLSAATKKTLWYINAAAANQPSICEIAVAFDGVTASAVPALVEFCNGTKATNSTPGTGSSSFTPVQVRGWPAQASAQTAANTITSEPTVYTTNKQFLLSPNGGLLVIQFPLGREWTGLASGTSASGNQLALAVTAPATVNARSYSEHEE